MAALGTPGERRGAAAKLGERKGPKCGALGLENHLYFGFRVSGRALDPGDQKRGFKSHTFMPFLFLGGVSVGVWECVS